MYHPPVIEINQEKTNEDNLYLEHQFEGKQLYKDFIPETLIGIEYLWGGPVQLRTTEIVKKKITRKDDKPEFKYREVLYTVKDRKVDKTTL